MSTDAVIVTIISSLIFGLVGVTVSTWYFYKLERHKLKLDLARRLLGNRFSISGDAFSCAMNEVIAVFENRCQIVGSKEQIYNGRFRHYRTINDSGTIVASGMAPSWPSG